MSFLVLKGHDVYLEKHLYSTNNRTAVAAYERGTGETVMFLTVNLPNENLKEGYVAIKNHSENEGILDELIVDNPIKYVKSGHVSIPICKLLI